MDSKEIISLLTLLDDSDKEVANLVEQKLLSYGIDALPIIEQQLVVNHDEESVLVISQLVDKIQYNKLLVDFKHWLYSEDRDLLEGVFLVTQFKYPKVQKHELNVEIEKIRLTAWLEMRHDVTPFEKVKILNYAFYQIHGFKGNVENYHNPSNSFISDFFVTKQGNPIMLCIVYMLVAQKLQLPVFGINLPQHFMLAYLEEDKFDLSHFDFNNDKKISAENKQALFYINAFNNGGIFTRTSLEQFVTQMRLELLPAYFEPCDNVTIIKRVLRNLAAAYKMGGDTESEAQVFNILYILGEPPLNHFTDITGANFDE
ncbi:MAG: transglutaminase-like domain-containing protein [Bacteroidota bacterium]